MAQYNDAAIVVIGRSGSESVDLPTEYLSFTQEERDLIQMATERFDKVILLLNVTNPINMTGLSRYDIDAVLWVGALGQEGAYAIGEALNGTVNPSGHLVDTWAADASSAPATANLSDYTITNSDVFAGNKYIVYAEGVYVGYRYYETRYEDAVLAQGNAGILTTMHRWCTLRLRPELYELQLVGLQDDRNGGRLCAERHRHEHRKGCGQGGCAGVSAEPVYGI